MYLKSECPKEDRELVVNGLVFVIIAGPTNKKKMEGPIDERLPPRPNGTLIFDIPGFLIHRSDSFEQKGDFVTEVSQTSGPLVGNKVSSCRHSDKGRCVGQYLRSASLSLFQGSKLS